MKDVLKSFIVLTVLVFFSCHSTRQDRAAVLLSDKKWQTHELSKSQSVEIKLRNLEYFSEKEATIWAFTEGQIFVWPLSNRNSENISTRSDTKTRWSAGSFSRQLQNEPVQYSAVRLDLYKEKQQIITAEVKLKITGLCLETENHKKPSSGITFYLLYHSASGDMNHRSADSRNNVAQQPANGCRFISFDTELPAEQQSVFSYVVDKNPRLLLKKLKQVAEADFNIPAGSNKKTELFSHHMVIEAHN